MAKFSFPLFCNRISLHEKAVTFRKPYIQVLHTLCFKDSDLFILPQLASFLAYHKCLLSFSHMVTTTIKTNWETSQNSHLLNIQFLVILKF